jgi:hypothetical protein
MSACFFVISSSISAFPTLFAIFFFSYLFLIIKVLTGFIFLYIFFKEEWGDENRKVFITGVPGDICGILAAAKIGRRALNKTN